MSAPAEESGVPFSFFVELIQAIAAIKPHQATERQPRTTRYADSPVYKTFKRWLTTLRERYTPLPPGTTATIFRLLFPEEDVHRKYGMQEARLAEYIAKIIGVSSASHGRGERLRKWKGEDSLGCLGYEVETVMASSSTAYTGTLSLGAVDVLLSELAAACAFSADAVRQSRSGSRRSREAIISEIYTSLAPFECSVVTQVILKDLRPLLYPIPKSASHYTSALLRYKSNAVMMLSKEAAMHAWDPSGRFSVIFKTRANLADAADAFEGFVNGEGLPQPTVGSPIQIPKCVKGQGTAHSLKALKGADKVWVETKYDGERAQIHVWLDEDGVPHIRIFSKSGRDSTLDRAGIHAVIYDALGISHADTFAMEGPDPEPRQPAFKHSIVVEAEMVAYSDVLEGIDEFWRIRSLIGRTAIGVRHKSPLAPSSTQLEVMETQCSMVSNGSDGGTRHLALVFFDILLLDGVSLLGFSYGHRRSILETLVRTRLGYAMLAERTCVELGRADTEEKLRRAFARVIADHQEGVVLKADGARYAEKRWPWVKLKRDYIPGHGDTVDLVMLAASWDKDRARELRVPPTAYTTFYFGALANGDELKAHPKHLPRFEVLFTASYGLGREQLEELNFIIKSSDPVPYSQCATAGLSYAFNMCPALTPPAVFLRQPLLAELFGAGFTKAPRNLFYALRFPRITKVFRHSDRPWIDGTSLQELQQIARAAVGRDRPGKVEDDWARSMFRPDVPPSPGVRSAVKRKRTEEMWVERLAEVDERVGTRSPKKRASRGGAITNARSVGARAEERADMHNNGEENVPLVEERSKPRIGMARLTSITNVGLSSAAHDATRPPPLSTTQHEDDCLPGPSNRPVTPRIAPTTPSRTTTSPNPLNPPLIVNREPPPSKLPEVNQNMYRTPPYPSAGHHATAAALTSAACNDMNVPQPLTIYEFLEDSIVWLARPHGAPRPAWRAPSRAIIPLACQTSTFDAILVGCGWGDTAPCTWATCGVVFVDEFEDRGEWLNYIADELTRRRAILLQQGKEEASKPIFVMSMRMLSQAHVAETATVEEFECRAICRFG
ncbi:hypothetical protein PYCCODRAFT_1385066 [Trametes coccinea BRFM310]|uniref:ATP-dependent DNA ligase family profile domain-containing protein n=1 Tax=Trametes coccinea (strain BRFM310) TaxID=1353009 RepID=A0A1Y2IXI3_TRAC3|nr:hypothetical protein PYCCODRAFT_1385066 [Trametes coccinea BRFM310]